MNSINGAPNSIRFRHYKSSKKSTKIGPKLTFFHLHRLMIKSVLSNGKLSFTLEIIKPAAQFLLNQFFSCLIILFLLITHTENMQSSSARHSSHVVIMITEADRNNVGSGVSSVEQLHRLQGLSIVYRNVSSVLRN